MTIWLMVVAALLFAYPFVIYPLIARLLPEPRQPNLQPEAALNLPVALVICALNEASVIKAKLENSFALDYPGPLNIYLVNDGSTDATAAIALGFVSQGLRMVDRQHRQGKVANLNQLIPTLTEDIVVLSDANVLYQSSAITRLVARFADPTVGCVSGKVVLSGTVAQLGPSEENYYSVEWMLQQKASGIYSMCGADGAMYAFRRQLFHPCPNDTIIEDFVIPMQIVAQGYRTVFEPRALAAEKGPESLREEFRRKSRIAAGAAQALLRRNGVPANAPARFWFVWLSHKFLRWVSPLTAIAMIGFALLNPQCPLAVSILAGWGLLSVLALIRLVSGISFPILDAPFYLLFAQVATAVGLWRGFRGTQSVLWEKANR